MKHSLTVEQDGIISAITVSNGRIVMVKARAGCGKTSTSLAVVNALKPKKGLYTAFNKAIVVEGKEKFPPQIECRTLHALALSFVRPKMKIEDFTYECISERMPGNKNDQYTKKKHIINAMDEFYRSASVNMWEFLDDLLEDEFLVATTVKYIELMLDDKVNPTFNFLLKYFHLLLHEEQIVVKYDLVILDEIQDSTGVALEIFKLLTAPNKLGLGDPAQGIYEFMNLVDGFDVLEDTVELELSHSFRVDQYIATQIQNFGRTHISADFHFEGTETPVEDGLTAYITMTNSQIVFRLHQLHKEGKRYTLTRSVSDIFACPLALTTAASGKEPYHKRYKFLGREYQNYVLSGHKSFFSYLKKEVKDEEIHNAIDILMKFKVNGINIWDVLKEAKVVSKRPDKTITVGTAFSLKGLEFSTVYIEDDINRRVNEIIEDGGVETQEQLVSMKVAYVACSRCRKHLKNCKFL